MGRKKIDRTGEVGVNNDGERMVIVKYGGNADIDVKFDDGTIVEHRMYEHFKNGKIKNPMSPSVFGVGCIGIGKFKSTENGKNTKCYRTWISMLQRCYDSKYQERFPTYKNCKVCKEWHNFQNFAKWYYENYNEFVNNERMELDKDILYKGNKIYSPETCIFVPQFINSLFVKSNKIRGEFPIGVSKHGSKYVALLKKGDGKQIYLGRYSTVEEAFQAYKVAKEQFIKELAEIYKDKIEHRLYEALMKYEVDIDD